MDLTMDYFQGLDELFDKDVTEDYLAESFNNGPIKFENIFDDNQTDQFDSIVPEDISCFLDTELKEGFNSIECAGKDLNLDLDHVLDDNNNTNKIDPIDYMFNFDDLDLEVGDACDIKQEIKSDMSSHQAFLSLPSVANEDPVADASHLFTIEHAFQTVKQEKVCRKSIGQNHKEVKSVKNFNLEDAIKSSMEKYPIAPKVEVLDKNSRKKYPIIPDIKDEEKCTKSKKAQTKDMKAFQFCDLCPFKTKEKSIFRMHTSLVHKLDASKCTKKTPQNSEKIFKATPPKKHRMNGAIVTITAEELEKKVASRKCAIPSLESTAVPTFSITHNGNPIDLNGTTKLNSFCYNETQNNVTSVKTKQENETPISLTEFLSSTDYMDTVNPSGLPPSIVSAAAGTPDQASFNGLLPIIDSVWSAGAGTVKKITKQKDSMQTNQVSFNGFLPSCESSVKCEAPVTDDQQSYNGFLPIIDNVTSTNQINHNGFLSSIDKVQSIQTNSNGFQPWSDSAVPVTTEEVSYNGFFPIINNVASVKTNQVNHNGFLPSTSSYETVDPVKDNPVRLLSSSSSVGPVKTNQSSFNGFLPSTDSASLISGFPGSTVTLTPVKTNPVTYNGFPGSTVTLTPVKTNAVTYNGFPRKTITVAPPNNRKASYSAFPGSVASTSSGLVPASGNYNLSLATLPKVSPTMGNHFLSANPGIVKVASCKIINSSHKKFVSILPKGPDCLINTFQQTSGKSSYRSNERLVRNSQERKRRSETKQALDAVKNLVPRLKFTEKPSQIKVLNETIEYVKHLRKEEQDDIEELEAQRRAFVMLESKYRNLSSTVQEVEHSTD